jgi:drug/metabolite transporter (DMT)-like permease
MISAKKAPTTSKRAPVGTSKPQSTVLVLIGLHVLLGLYALSDVFSKSAANTTFASWQFFLFYALVLVMLGIYALGWQQVIKRLPLTTAYANRAITIVWGIFWGAILFGEAITIGKLVGAIIIICGIVLFVRCDATDETGGDSK